MKKVLILAYDFPPYVSVGGLRPYNWHKYMHEFDVYPIVVTRQWNNTYGNYLDYIAPGDSDKTIIEKTSQGTIIRAPYFPNFGNRLMLKYGDSKYKFIRKAVSAFYEFTQFIFLIGPKSTLYFAAEEYIKNNPVDIIIASGDPFILFKYASKLSKNFDTPWIADYRDLWSKKRKIQQNPVLKNWHSYFEKKTVGTSSLIITVSDFLKIQISDLIKNKEFLILPNGYDPEAVEGIREITKNHDALTIAFAGSIYDWHPIRSFLTVVSDFLKNNNKKKLKLNFYGINIVSELKSIISTDFPDLQEHINIFPKMLNNLILNELAKENIMLLFNDYSIMGTKIYDYIGINRTTLLCYVNDNEANRLKEKYYPIKKTEEVNNHLQEDLINETNSGYAIQDAKHLRVVLEQLYDEFIKNGYIQCNAIHTKKYSRKHQVKLLAEVIKKIT